MASGGYREKVPVLGVFEDGPCSRMLLNPAV